MVKKEYLDNSLIYLKENKTTVIYVYLYFLVLSLINTKVTTILEPGENLALLFAFLIELVQMIGSVLIIREFFYDRDKALLSKFWQAICDAPLFLFYNFVVALNLLMGLVLFVLPAFYFTPRVYFAPYISIVAGTISDDDRSYVEWSKEITKNKLRIVLLFIILFHFLPLGIFAPFSWLELGQYEDFVRYGICPVETFLSLFAELIFIQFFKDLINNN